MTDKVHEAQAFAVIKDGLIKVHTISETPRAAKVNYLVVDCGVAVRIGWTDDQIRVVFEQHARNAEVALISCTYAGRVN